LLNKFLFLIVIFSEFILVADASNLQAGVLVPCQTFQPCLIFASTSLVHVMQAVIRSTAMDKHSSLPMQSSYDIIFIFILTIGSPTKAHWTKNSEWAENSYQGQTL
jgi:hypothetical protein